MSASEEWRSIDYAPGYEVSDQGRVRSWLSRWGALTGPRVRKLQTDHGGYHRVDLIIDGRRINAHVTHLVAHAFNGPRPEGLVIRHLDGNPKNDTPANLKYGTHSENAYDKVRHGRHHKTHVTHCPQGHVYDEENTRWDKGRHCKACIRAASAACGRAKRRTADAARTYYYPREVAALFGVTVTCIANWAKAGKLPVDHTTPIGQRRYAKADVDALLTGSAEQVPA